VNPVGYETQLAQLNSFLWPAIAGQGRVAFITGQAGTNSRAFVEGVLSQAQAVHPTLTVALGECRVAGAPYLPFTEIMRLLTGDVTGDLEDNALSAHNADRLRGLLSVSGEALMEFGPSLLNLFIDGAGLLASASLLLTRDVPWLERLRRRQAAGPQVRQERLEQGRLFEEYTDVLIAIARQQPLVLGLLDLQWADEGSIGLLFHLSRRIKDVPLLIIGTYRPEEVTVGRTGERHPLVSTLNEITRYYGQVTIALDPPQEAPTDQPTPKRRLADGVTQIAARPATPAPPAVREQTPEAAPSARFATCFVGRERELAQLDAFLAAALGGQGQVSFVTGEPGAGKSTLISEFARQAQHRHPDLVVAVGDCNAQTGTGDAYLPFREILSMLTGDLEGKLADQAISQDNATRLQGLLRWSGQALVELGPDLIDIFVPGSGLLVKGTTLLAEKAGWTDKLGDLLRRRKGEPEPSASGLEQSHLFEQYTRVICRLAERNPLVLVLDDLQWADEASIALLFHLARRIADHPVLLIGTYRPNDVAMGRGGQRHPLEPVVAELKRYHAQIEVNLSRAMGEEDGLRFVSDYVDTAYVPHRLDESFKALIHERTRGHALFVVELLRALEEQGVLTLDDEGAWYQARPVQLEDLPARVEAVIDERIARLNEELREILACASVEGEDFTAQVIAHVQGVNERQLARRLAQELGKRHHLVGESGVERIGRRRLFLWHFRHGMVQNHVYRELSKMERMVLHEDVARSLQELYGEEADQVAVQLAHHFLAAEVFDEAFKYLTLAGEQARMRYANEEAIQYYRTALEVAEEVAADVGAERITILEHLGDVLINSGEYDQALESYVAALRFLEESLPDDARERTAALRRKTGMVYERKGEYAVALDWLAQARETLGDAHSPEMARISISTAGIMYRQGEALQALEWCQQGLAIAEATAAREELAHAYLLRGTIHTGLGELGQAADDYLRSLALSQELGDLLQQAKADNSLGAVYYYMGDWEKAVDHYRRSLEARETIGDVNGVTTVSNNLGEVYLLQGEFEAATQCFQRCLESWERTGFPLGVALSHRNLGQIHIRCEEWDQALTHLEAAQGALEEMGSRDWLVAEVCRHLAEVHLGRGDCETAARFCQRALEIARTQKLGLVEGNARRAAGQVYRCQGRWEDAETAFRQSLQLLEAQDLPYEAGQTWWELALLCRDWATAEGSNEHWSRASEAQDRAILIFEKLGAEWDLARAQAMRNEM
jgi:predicted ATPase/Flp pilus assembly protein TadD